MLYIQALFCSTVFSKELLRANLFALWIEIKYVQDPNQELGWSKLSRQARKIHYWCLPQLVLGIFMEYCPLDNCAVVGFIRPPASTPKWLFPAPPEWLWFGWFFHHETSNWLILESHRVSGQAGCLFLCQISQESSAEGQKPGRGHPGLQVQYLSVCFCVFTKRSQCQCACCYAYEQEYTCLQVQIQSLLFQFWPVKDMAVFISCVSEYLWLTEKWQTNVFISLFHLVPPCPLSVHCLCLLFLISLASFLLILPHLVLKDRH